MRHASLLHRLHDPDNMAASLTQPAPLSRQLPLPLFEGNFGNYSTDCHYAEDIKGYVHSNTGFNFTSEGPEWDPRSGYVSWQPGSQLEFKVLSFAPSLWSMWSGVPVWDLVLYSRPQHPPKPLCMSSKAPCCPDPWKMVQRRPMLQRLVTLHDQKTRSNPG